MLDLGCGNGIFSFGALALGASFSVGIDCAENASEAVKNNIRHFEALLRTGKKPLSTPGPNNVDFSDQITNSALSKTDSKTGEFHFVQGYVEENGTIPFIKKDFIFDTVIMNPPFGCQNRGADIPFLIVGLTHGRTLYSFHIAETAGFIEKTVEKYDAKITDVFSVQFEIRHTFSFHRKKKAFFQVSCLRIETLHHE